MGSTIIPDNGLVILDSHGKQISLFNYNPTLVIKESGLRNMEYTLPVNQVLWVELAEDDVLCLSLLQRQKNGLALRIIKGNFDPTLHETAVQWTDALMDAAYEDRRRSRRFKVIINPRGGLGKAYAIFDKVVKPILEAANCTSDVMVTEYCKHCYEYCKTMSLDYDAVLVLSGDGLVHEVFNAFAERTDAMDAFAVPVVQIPAGSANGFSLCLLGVKDGHDICAATLNAIKGRQMKIDLCSVRQGDKRHISFMSQAMGMMADIDIGTESLRWLGDVRFIAGFIREVGVNRRCPVKLEIQVAAQDKKAMHQTYRASRALTLTRTEDSNGPASYAELHSRQSDLSPSEFAEDGEGWTTFDKPLAYVYAGKLPYVSRDLMQFPIALSDDGFIDIVAQEHCSRRKLLKGANGAAEGKQYWISTQHYFKARAYRITPFTKKGNLSIDGEKYPLLPFQVEVHPRMGTTLGGGGWHTDFR